MPLISARHLYRSVVIEPGTLTEKSQRGKHLVADLFVHQVGSQLGLDELIKRHVVVECLNHPVAIQICVRVRVVAAPHWIQTSVVVFSKPGHIEPNSPPPLTVLWRCKKPVNNLCK